MAQGHINQQHHNIGTTWSASLATTPPTIITVIVLDNVFIPLYVNPPNVPDTCTHTIYTKYILVTGKIFIDQTSQFPHKSIASNMGLLGLYCFYSNYIQVEYTSSIRWVRNWKFVIFLKPSVLLLMDWRELMSGVVSSIICHMYCRCYRVDNEVLLMLGKEGEVLSGMIGNVSW